jgi:hypothetical protein
MDNEKELWDRLENEPERAFRAFESFLTLPSSERTIINAYRAYVGNPHASKPSDTWSRWSSDFAWRERAAAFDDHMASKRREAFERGMEEEAEWQGTLAERTRGRKNELMTVGYEKAMEWFENTDFSDLRISDVIQIIKLHIEDVKNEAVHIQPEVPTWTEEDDADFRERIWPLIEAQRAVEEPEEASQEGEEDSEESEDGED